MVMVSGRALFDEGSQARSYHDYVDTSAVWCTLFLQNEVWNMCHWTSAGANPMSGSWVPNGNNPGTVAVVLHLASFTPFVDTCLRVRGLMTLPFGPGALLSVQWCSRGSCGAPSALDQASTAPLAWAPRALQVLLFSPSLMPPLMLSGASTLHDVV